MSAQHGEDKILQWIFSKIGDGTARCVEFGAWDGVLNSNTYDLIVNHGWYGVMIEADAERFEALKQTCASVLRGTRAIHRTVGFDAPNTLDDILRDHGDGIEPSLVSIDIDGCDYHVFDAMQAQPSVVVVEFNPSMPNHLHYVQARDMAVNHGSSLLALVELAQRKGYELAATTVTNAIFVRDDAFPLLGIRDNSIDALHPSRSYETNVVQLYDGTLLMCGVNRLMWHDKPVRIEVVKVEAP